MLKDYDKYSTKDKVTLLVLGLWVARRENLNTNNTYVSISVLLFKIQIQSQNCVKFSVTSHSPNPLKLMRLK